MEIELIRIFVKVIQQGGFSKAANALQIPKSTISKAVTRLEQETGTKLLLRTTRSQTLTAAGRVFYEACLGPIQTLEDAQKSLYGMDNIVAGKVKITAPEDLGNYVVSPVIGWLCLKYPKLEFELNYTNEVLDLVKDGYDIAIRLGKLPASSLRQRRVGDFEMVPVAAPTYLKSKKRISAPKDLETLDCLTITSSSMTNEWTFKNEKKIVRIKVRSQVQSNQVSSLMKIALSGAGIALLPGYLCQSEIDQGKLIRILPEWHGIMLEVSIISPVSTNSSSRLHLVSSEIASRLKTVLDGK